MNVVLWLAAGALIGLLASGGANARSAIATNVLTGIVGALLTGWLFSWLLAPLVDHGGVSLPGMLVAPVGASLLLALVHTGRNVMS